MAISVVVGFTYTHHILLYHIWPKVTLILVHMPNTKKSGNYKTRLQVLYSWFARASLNDFAYDNNTQNQNYA